MPVLRPPMSIKNTNGLRIITEYVVPHEWEKRFVLVQATEESTSCVISYPGPRYELCPHNWIIV